MWVTGICILTGRAGAGTDKMSVTVPTQPIPAAYPECRRNIPAAASVPAARPGQNWSLGRYVPQTSRSTPHTSPTVARARSASRIG